MITSEIQEILQQIPIKHNLASMIMFCGFVQGFLLYFVITLKSRQASQPVRLMGWFIGCLSLIGLDVYLCYTGLMKYMLWANDYSEVFILLLGPLVLFFLQSILRKEQIDLKSNWFHFILPVFYLIIQSSYFVQPLPFKLNAYTSAYYPDLPFIEEPAKSGFVSFTFAIRAHWRFIMLFSVSGYLLLSIRILLMHRNKIQNVLWLGLARDKYSFSKNLVWLFLLAFSLIAVVFWNFKNDLGDHYISIFFSLTLFGINIFMLSESRFFEKSWIADKYDTSGLKTDSQSILEAAITYVKEKSYHLNSDASLKDLAKQLNISSNYLSQAINGQSGQNFNDFINYYRIEEAQKRLLDENYAHLNVAGIGQSVGFNSKSAFYAAFKKLTQTTPSAYLKGQKQSIKRPEL